jgi:hypothetical protein
VKSLILAACLVLASTLAAFPSQNGQDGEFRDPDTGEVQPALCDNAVKNQHKCSCSRADEKCEGQNGSPSRNCQTYCRISACKCVNGCTS